MSSTDKPIIYINGHAWKNVTNITTAGQIYDIRDVIACDGRVPDFASGYTPKLKKENK